MATIQAVGGIIRDAFLAGGRPLLAAQFPEEIDDYQLTFQAADINNNLIEIFSFPVLPSDINETETFGVQARKMYEGVSVTFNPNYDPLDISINGTFGRSLKLAPTHLVGRILDTLRINASAQAFPHPPPPTADCRGYTREGMDGAGYFGGCVAIQRVVTKTETPFCCDTLTLLQVQRL